MRIIGTIIAGGRSRRMDGNEKAFLMLEGRLLISHVADRMTPQVEALSINANGDPARFSELGLRVVCDSVASRSGPLSGLATMLDDAAMTPGTTHLATAPGDCPFLPDNLVHRLASSLETAPKAAIAVSRGRNHPIIGLWPVTLAQHLRNHLETTDRLSVMGFLDTIEWHGVEFDAGHPDGADPFFNVNTPDDLETARRFLSDDRRLA